MTLHFKLDVDDPMSREDAEFTRWIVAYAIDKAGETVHWNIRVGFDICCSTVDWFNSPLSSFVYFTFVRLSALRLSVYGTRYATFQFIKYRFDTPPSLVWDYLKLPSPGQPQPQHCYPA